MLRGTLGPAASRRHRAQPSEVGGFQHTGGTARLTTLSFPSLQALLAVASNPSEPVTRRCGALDALQEVVEAIDNACDLEKLGGIHTLVALLAVMEKDVRRGAAWVMGAAAQNNPEVQDQVSGSYINVWFWIGVTKIPLLKFFRSRA
jgi:hypothetical protein